MTAPSKLASFLASAALAFACVAFSGCEGQPPEDEPPLISVGCSEEDLPKRVEGIVKSTSEDTIALEADGKDITLSALVPAYLPKQEILQREIAELNEGDQVAVSYFERDGIRTLDSIVRF